jgi:pimeloyl-ACP methyl ester carboxylesterase
MPGKPTVLLIHGLTGTSRWWAPVISRLPEEVGVIAPDLRGRGRSWETAGPYDLMSLAPDISLCLGHFEIPKATIAGYSMGAWLTSLYGSTRPNRVSGIVLVDGGVRIDFDPAEKPMTVLETMMGPSLARLEMTFTSVDEYIDFWRSHPAFSRRWDQQLERIFAYEVGEVRRGTYRSLVNGQSIVDGGNDILFDEQVIKAVHELTVPTRLLIADHDMADRRGGFVSEQSAREAASRNPHVTLQKLTGLNHFTALLGDGASAVASAIVALL